MVRVAILDNLRSAYNVGSIFRTALALNYQELALCGVTMSPPSKKLSETSRGADRHIKWKHFSEIKDALIHYQERGFYCIALEKTDQAISIQNLASFSSLAWVVGNEALGVSKEVLDMAEQHCKLPILSEQSSINVSCAFSSAAYIDYLKHCDD